MYDLFYTPRLGRAASCARACYDSASHRAVNAGADALGAVERAEIVDALMLDLQEGIRRYRMTRTSSGSSAPRHRRLPLPAEF